MRCFRIEKPIRKGKLIMMKAVKNRISCLEKSLLGKGFKYFIVFLFIFFYQNFIFAQSFKLIRARKPDYICRYSYENNGDDIEIQTREVLPPHKYPWGVCFNYYNELSNNEKSLTREAMRMWNNRYKEYVQNKWPTNGKVISSVPVGICGGRQINKYVVYGIPNVTNQSLFVESCNKKRYNIIYLRKTYLPWDFSTHMLGAWIPKRGFLLRNFYGKIEIQKRDIWISFELFLNTMLHELGHALGLGHLPNWYTEVMNSAGNTNKCDKESDICDILSGDFDEMLKPYNPHLEVVSNTFSYIPSEDKMGNNWGICP